MLINNRYQVIRSLGEGGFGQAYLAEDTQMPSKRQCVIKQLKPITSSTEIYELVQARFQREAAILEKLGENHPQIPRLYAYFTEEKNFYLVQEWIEGTTLESLTLPQAESTVRKLLTSILPVLAFVHEQGIIHRDIKPGNIILRSGSQQPVLIDFGAVKETVNTAVGANSASSIVIGTPGYMATEQAAGRPLPSSDLYSLALTAIHLLTGKSPQELPSDSQTGEILWPQTANEVTAELVAVLTKAIRYHPRDRYTSANEMLSAIATSTSTNPTSLPPTVLHPPIGNQPPTPQPSISQPAYNLEAAPTEVKAPANYPSQNDAPRASSFAPLTIGLASLAVVGIVTGRWLISRPVSTPDNTPGQNTAALTENSGKDLDSNLPQDLDKCFNLLAYDPEDTSVNVRSSPNGNLIDTLPNLSIVQQEGPALIETGWNLVNINDTGIQGYILGDLLYRTTYQVNDPSDTSANLRQTPDGELIAAIDNSTEVKFLGTNGSWTQVELNNGQSGYISTSRLAEPNCF
ncbi:MAG: protein kinase [Cyanobacteria bacterium J06629_19]